MRDSRYLVVFGACLTQFTVIGVLFSYGLFFKSFETEFGWSRTLLSTASSLAFFMMGTLAMVGGRLNDRFGPRRVLGITGVLYGLGFALISQVTAPWQLFAIFATFLGLGLGTHDVVTLGTIARWFERRRGMMSGVIKVGTAAGQIAMPPIAALLIVWLGWQNALVVIGLTASVLLLVAALAMRSPPEPAPGQSSLGLGDSFATVRRTPVFWRLCAIQFLFFPSMMSVPLHLPVHGQDLGMTGATAATLLSIMGFSSIAGRLSVGALVDRIGGRNAFVICFAFLIAALASLAVITSHWLLFSVVAIYGFGHGGLFTVVSPTVAAYFGMRAHGAIFGAILFFGTLGGTIGPILVGMAFDNLGTYQPAFIGLAIAATLGLGLVLSLPAPRPVAQPAG
ncbi:MAG: MFS transporter [Rhodobacter sp.]|nr:MFS transporter [Rhodobacter sp.]